MKSAEILLSPNHSRSGSTSQLNFPYHQISKAVDSRYRCEDPPEEVDSRLQLRQSSYQDAYTAMYYNLIDHVLPHSRAVTTAFNYRLHRHT